jgi:hypothetical protein
VLVTITPQQQSQTPSPASQSSSFPKQNKNTPSQKQEPGKTQGKPPQRSLTKDPKPSLLQPLPHQTESPTSPSTCPRRRKDASKPLRARTPSSPCSESLRPRPAQETVEASFSPQLPTARSPSAGTLTWCSRPPRGCHPKSAAGLHDERSPSSARAGVECWSWKSQRGQARCRFAW